MMKKLMAAALGALACTPFLLEDPVRAAGLPCESELIAARPSPPTNLRILGPGKAVSASDPGRPAARPASATVASSGGVHSYYEELARQSDCRAAYSMRSQAQLDAIDTGGIGGKKKPVLYDSVVDAARFTIFAPDTTDTQQKHLPVRIDAGSMLLTWDFRFDRNFAWEEPGY